MSVINQKEYLKKYLGLGKGDKKKRRKKDKTGSKTVQIIDDDDLDQNKFKAIEDDLNADNDDAPQIVAVIDERPPSMRVDEQKNKLWIPLGQVDDEEPVNSGFKFKVEPKSPPRRAQNGQNRNSSPQRRVKREPSEDRSPPRRRHNRASSEDNSPPRMRRNTAQNEDNSPPRRRQKRASSNDHSPPRRQRNIEDNSPARRHKRSPSKDNSPPRRAHKNNKDNSPPRRKRTNSDSSPPRRQKRPQSEEERDNSPPRRTKIKQEKGLSPTGTSAQKQNLPIPVSSIKQEKDSDQDNSPPRRTQHNRDLSPPRRKKSRFSDRTPPRTTNADLSPPRREYIPNSDSDQSPPRRQNTNKQKMSKTLDGKKAGLQNAKDLIKETESMKRREEEMFKKMSAEVSGVNAKTVVRNRKPIDIEEEERKAQKQKEVQDTYNRWGKGLKQVEDQNERIQQERHEMNKPLARYADDEDLEEYLKNQERAGDPMLQYIRKKRRQEAVESGEPEKPQYMGDFLPNRYGIRPGYRWDGVDRSSGYEKKWFTVQNERKAAIDEAYKWSTEDM